MRRFGVVVVLAACNQVFALEETELVPAPDTDGDTIADVDDNCVDVPNPTQADEDADAIGDRCDNCPWLANTRQQDDGDHDGIGDDCDPHPLAPGDCLVLFDTFADPSAFDAHWSLLLGLPAVRAEAGAIVLAPGPTATIRIGARHDDGTPFDASDAALIGRWTLTANSGAGVLTRANGAGAGYSCQVRHHPTYQEVISWSAAASTQDVAAAAMFSEPILDGLTVRLVSQDPTESARLQCRADHGITFGSFAQTPSATAQPSGGTPAIIVTGNELRVEAFAAYLFAPRAAACPESVVR